MTLSTYSALMTYTHSAGRLGISYNIHKNLNGLHPNIIIFLFVRIDAQTFDSIFFYSGTLYAQIGEHFSAT